MQVPSTAELERWFDAENVKDVQFLETVASWPSLRILEYLYEREDPVTTGEIARELNMDMRDVKDRLDALEEHGVVAEKGQGWSASTDQITMSIDGSDGLSIAYGLDSPSADPEPSTQTEADATDRSESVFARIRQAVTAPFR